MKKYILLLVLIINLVPYIKDGEMKWTTTEAGAQYYTIEIVANGFLCGNTDDSNDKFFSSLKCENIVGACSCPRCHKQRDCNKSCRTTTPCEKCATPIYCGSTCQNPNCGKYNEDEETNPDETPPIQTGGGGVPEVKEYIQMNISLNRYVQEKNNWCVFNTLGVLKDISPCSLASWYFYNYKPYLNTTGCEIDDGVSEDHMAYMYDHVDIYPTLSVSDYSTLENILKNKGGLLQINKSGKSSLHMILYYGIHVDTTLAKSIYQLINIFDTLRGGACLTYLDAVSFGDNLVVN